MRKIGRLACKRGQKPNVGLDVVDDELRGENSVFSFLKRQIQKLRTDRKMS